MSHRYLGKYLHFLEHKEAEGGHDKVVAKNHHVVKVVSTTRHPEKGLKKDIDIRTTLDSNKDTSAPSLLTLPVIIFE